MSRVEKSLGWLPLAQAVCDACRWRGPERNASTPGGRALAKLDAQDHDNCPRAAA